MTRIILASTSPYRKRALKRLGLDFESVPPICDERAAAAGILVSELALYLARLKADSVQRSEPDAIIIASDQVARIGDQLLHKPGTPEKAREQLRFLAGKTHQLETACVVSHGDQVLSHLERHFMTMRALSEAEIAAYVEREPALDCCGSYMIEGLGISLFESIVGSDFTAIQGLPLMHLSHLLRKISTPTSKPVS